MNCEKINFNVVFLIAISILLIMYIQEYNESINRNNISSNTKLKPFIESSTFEGEKKGYVFKTENGITGYYLDE